MQNPAFQQKMKIILGEKVIQTAVEKAKRSLDETGTDFNVENLKQRMEENFKKLNMKDFPIRQEQSELPVYSKEKRARFLEMMENMDEPESRKEAIEIASDPSMLDELKIMLHDDDFLRKFHKLHKLPDRDELKRALLEIPILKSLSEGES
jgi:hypothetical protein